MTLTHKRILKNIVVDLMAYMLSAILLVIIVCAVIGIIGLITFVIENPNIVTMILITVVALIMMFLEFREE